MVTRENRNVKSKLSQDKERYYIMIRVNSQEERIIICTKVTDIDKTYGRKSTTIVGNFNITFSVMGKNIQQIMSKLREDLNNTVNQMDLKTYIDRTFHATQNMLLFLKCT